VSLIIILLVSGPLGHLDFHVHEMHFTTFSIQNIGVNIIQNVGFTAEIDNVQIAVNANWDYREREWPHIKDHGTVDIYSTLSSKLVAHVSIDETGKLVVTIDPNLYIQLSNFDVKLHGGASWLYK
jgi:hypothetical protein